MSEIVTEEKSPRLRKPINYALGWVQITEGVLDEDDKVVDGSGLPCFVVMDFPPGMTEAQKRNRSSIQLAVRKAVYEQGLKEYGNKKFVVLSYGEEFDAPFVERTETKLVPK